MDKILIISLAMNSILAILFCLACQQNFEYKQSKRKFSTKIKEDSYGKCKGI